MIATVENTAAKLPPSERDFQVYRFVRVETNSTRAAAQVFAISQTRVRQVVSRVVEYLLAVAREGLEEDEEERAGSVVVAEQIARMQLEYLYQTAIGAWNESQAKNGLGQTSLGQVRYLSLAARISLLMSKVPMHAPPRTREEELEEFDEAEEHAPPARDCSPRPLSRPEREQQSPPVVETKAFQPASYKSLDEIKAEVRKSFLRPAQAETAADDEPLESGEPKRPLSRRERRARQRELERRLKKR